jgi:hypothetical protein
VGSSPLASTTLEAEATAWFAGAADSKGVAESAEG